MSCRQVANWQRTRHSADVARQIMVTDGALVELVVAVAMVLVAAVAVLVEQL